MAATRPLVLLTGGTGFLGRRVAAALLADGATPRLLVRPGRRDAAGDLVARGAEIADGDVTSRSSLEAAAAGCAAIVHAAARVSRGGRRDDFDRVNVGGLANVLAAAERAGVGRVVYTSSFFALGPSDTPGVGPEGLDESAIDRDVADLDLYQASKHRALRHAAEAARGGAPLVVLVPGVLVGPGPLTEGNFVTTMVRDHLAGRLVPLPAGGRHLWSFVHVDDVASAHVAALRRGRTGEAYVLGGDNSTLVDVFRIVERLTRRPPPRVTVPFAALWALGAVEEALELLGRRPRLVTRGVARVLSRDWATCSAKARREMGYEPRSLEATLDQTIRWLVDEGHVPAPRGGGSP